MAGQRKPRKRVPDPPDLPAEFEAAPPTLFSGAHWDCLAAGADTEVADRLADVDLQESVWRDADLVGRRFDGFRCRDMTFERCDLSGAVFQSATFTRVVFTGCRMTGTSLGGATLQDVRVTECRADLMNLRLSSGNYLLIEESVLPEADFEQAILTRSGIVGCDLAGARFANCRMTDVDLHGSNLEGLSGALSLRGATIGAEQLIALAPALALAAGITVRSRQPSP